MRHRMRFSIALTSGLLLSLVIFAFTAQGQTERRIVADTGVITLGPNQVLRVTAIALQEATQMESRKFSFRQIAYTEGTCDGGVCKHSILSQSVSDTVTLGPGESASIDIHNTAFGVRAMVLSNSRDVKITAHIIDLTTGNIIAILIG